MKVLLIRIGVDNSYGGWNAPADPKSDEFVYVPIPESAKTTFRPQCERRYEEVLPAIEQFAAEHGKDVESDLKFPRRLLGSAMHLDPDFEHLTYGDDGARRGAKLRDMGHDDLVVFYAGMRSIRPQDARLIYALVGLYVVDEVVEIGDVRKDRWYENAHTRKTKMGEQDIIVHAKPGVSGRFDRFLDVGEYRNGSYRVRRDVLDAWGDLSVNDGWIQRSASPPSFKDPARFYEWFHSQDIKLRQRNN